MLWFESTRVNLIAMGLMGSAAQARQQAAGSHGIMKSLPSSILGFLPVAQDCRRSPGSHSQAVLPTQDRGVSSHTLLTSVPLRGVRNRTCVANGAISLQIWAEVQTKRHKLTMFHMVTLYTVTSLPQLNTDSLKLAAASTRHRGAKCANCRQWGRV